MKYVSLDYIIKNVISQLEESSLRRYQTYLQYTIRGYRFLNLNGGNSQIVKTVKLPMLANKAINLPSDYVKFVKIGMCINGRIIILGLDESICLNDNYSACGDPLEAVINNANNGRFDFPYFQYGFPFWGYYQNNQYVESMFGMGGGFNGRGYYKFNYETNQIQFASVIPGMDIMLEYISDGINADGTALVPVEASEYLINYVHWKRVEALPKTSESEIQRWERRTMVEFRNTKHFAQSFDMDTYLEYARSNVQQLPKR